MPDFNTFLESLDPRRPNRGQEYLRKNRFTILVEGTDGLWFERQLLSMSIPNVTFTIEEWWNGIAPTKMTTQGKFENVTCEFYVNIAADPVFKWINQTLQHKDPLQAKLAAAITYKKRIVLNMVDGNNIPLIQWQLIGCQIQSVRFEPLTYKSDGEVLTVTLELTMDRVIYPGANNRFTPSPLLSMLEQFTGIPVSSFINNPATAIGMVTNSLGVSNTAATGLLGLVVNNTYGGGTTLANVMGSGGSTITNFMGAVMGTTVAVDAIGHAFR